MTTKADQKKETVEAAETTTEATVTETQAAGTTYEEQENFESDEYLIACYIAALAAIDQPAFDAENAYHHNKYVKLSTLQKVIKDALLPYGVVYMQNLFYDDELGYYSLCSSIRNKSSVYALSSMRLDAAQDPQKFGAQLTYAKRQLAQLDFGICGDTDDDGNSARPTAAAPAPQPAKIKPINRKGYIMRLVELQSEAITAGASSQELIDYTVKSFGTDDIGSLTSDQMKQYAEFLKGLTASYAKA